MKIRNFFPTCISPLHRMRIHRKILRCAFNILLFFLLYEERLFKKWVHENQREAKAFASKNSMIKLRKGGSNNESAICDLRKERKSEKL